MDTASCVVAGASVKCSSVQLNRESSKRSLKLLGLTVLRGTPSSSSPFLCLEASRSRKRLFRHKPISKKSYDYYDIRTRSLRDSYDKIRRLETHWQHYQATTRNRLRISSYRALHWDYWIQEFFCLDIRYTEFKIVFLDEIIRLSINKDMNWKNNFIKISFLIYM